MTEDIGVEQFDQQSIEFGVDKSRLRQQALRRRFVIGDGVRREVRIDLDAPAILVTAARMDREALEV